VTTLEIAEKLMVIFRRANTAGAKDKAREEYARQFYDAMVWCMAAMEGKNGSGWVSVEDRPPESDGSVLVWITEGRCGSTVFKNYIALAEYDPGWGWILDGYKDPEELTITHWMELPAGPEGKR